MRLGSLTTLVVLCLVALTGCGDEAPAVLAMKIELKALKQEFEYLRAQAEDLDPRIRNAEQMALQAIDDREAPLRLDCVQRTPGVVQTRLAPITAVCQGLASIPGGSRLSLKLGNLTSARLEGLRLTVYAGEGAALGRASTRTYIELMTALPPGEWRTVDIELPTTANFGAPELALRAQINTITLAQR